MVPRFNHIYICILVQEHHPEDHRSVGQNMLVRILWIKYWSAFVGYFYILDNNKHLIAIKGG